MSNKGRKEPAEAVRFDLLKSTYRVDRETQPDVHAAAEAIATKPPLDVPITIYQAKTLVFPSAASQPHTRRTMQ